MQVLSRMYRRDFLIYELNADHSPVAATNNGFEKKILLCRVDSHHLDSVYPAAFVQNAAVCQSIIYEILYRSVFRLDQELSEAVDLLRDQNKHKRSRLDSFITQTYDITGLGEAQLQRLRDLHISKERHLQRVTPPLPYRIAKALDPDIYRNVELDIWEEERRELSREANLCKETKFSPGDKCQVFDNGCLYHGHIQELAENEGPVLVFIEELGQKRTVPYQSLKPVPAKNNSQFVFYKNYRRRKDMPVSMTAVSKGYTPNIQVTNYQQMAPPVSHQQLQQTDDSYKVNFFTNQTLGHHHPGARSFHMNTMQQVNSMDQAAISSQYPSSPNQQGPRNFSAPPLHHFMQYSSNIGSPVAMYPGYQPSVPIPPPMYTYICVPHLETIQLTQVNLNSQPSQDAMGKDLPHTDMNTLRFFYNLGIEHYRTLMTQTSMWPSSVDLQQITPDQMNGNICSGTASQVTACSMSNYPTAACPPAAFYYTNQTFPTGAPQPCLPAPQGVSSGPGIAYFSGAQPFSLPPPSQMQIQSPSQASH
ncbi:hypothetical protein CHS0354_039930 [Potamilus streckersoni]|uniref:Uncharacterized protein n=1 Tax=Potamilus streckersoni TaxID=2493646 RepID=A0AAE0TGX2_9BIVA|nr:hypothetical protein CHS0354_039930 [Potamilus streckersoni]